MKKKILIVFGIVISIVLFFLALKGEQFKIPFSGRAQADTIRLTVKLPSSEEDTILLQSELKALSPGFIRVSTSFDQTQMQLSSVENKSQLKKSGYTGDMIYSTPIKEANITGRYVIVVGSKPGTSIEGRVFDDIAAIRIKKKSGSQLSKRQMQEITFKIDEKDSQVVSLDGIVIPFEVDYSSKDPEITQASTRR
jgi:hypothetical protein